ncbi:MAG: hypothetical protein ACI4MB_05435 [Candidatus Coproplasma sp.]
MLKKLRKSVIAFLVAVPAICACSAIAFTALNHFDSGETIVAEAESGTVVTEVGDVIRTFNGTAYYGPDNNKYWVTKVLDGDGAELEEAEIYGVTQVGEYTFCYTPNTGQGCVWADGSVDEKNFKVTITQATLLWKFIDRTTTVDVADAYKEVKYTESRSNYISKVYAECNNLAYNKSSDSDSKGVTIVKNGETTIKKNVVDAGTYTFTVAEEDIENYKNPTFTLKILPMEIDIGKSVNLNWTVEDAVNESLANGNVYCYTYNLRGSEKVVSVYTTLKLSKAPFSNWENWTEDESDNAYLIEGIAAYKEDRLTKIKLYRDSGSLQLYNAVYSGECSATESGKYVAKAVITPVDNYVLTYTPSDTQKNMTIMPLEDGAYEITKTWYVAYYVNEFMSQTSFENGAKTEYAFPQQWTFGELNEEITAPCLAHGDEVRMSRLVPDCYAKLDDVSYDGYYLDNLTDHERILVISGGEIVYGDGMEEWESGEKDLVTFSIVRDDGTTVCINELRSKLSYYVNTYMPVGKYTITFRAKNVGINETHLDWWDGNRGSNCGNVYFGITASYDFEVTAQELSYTDNLSFYNKADKSPIELNLNTLSGNLDAFFALAYDRFEYSAITKADVLESQTYWSTVVDAYYGDTIELRFKLKGSDDDNYYSKYSTVWDNRISKLTPESYYLYYTINMPNYVSVPQERDLDKYYFEVTVFEEVELPRLVLYALQYTGSPRTVQVYQIDDRYSITGGTNTEKGEYKVKFALSNPILNHWMGAEGAVYELDWSIVDKPQNGWVEGGELHLVDWFWNGFNRENNVITAIPKSGEPVFSITTDEVGQNFIEGLSAFTIDNAGRIPYDKGVLLAALPVGEYYLWSSIVETETHAPFVSTSYKFTVKQAQNAWVNEPKLNSWKVGETPDLSGINGASPLYGTAVYKIVSEFDEGQIYYDSASGLNDTSEMPVGRYYLIATVEGNAAAYSGLTLKQSVLVLTETSDETWLIQPEIGNWKHGETPSEPIAMSAAEGSVVEYSYLTKGGELLESQPTEVGEYILVAVVYSQNGAELARSQVAFKITGVNAWVNEPKLNSWKVGETPDLSGINGASPLYGTAVYKIVSEFDEGQIYYDSASGLNDTSDMPVGRYYLIATVDGNADVYDGLTLKQSVLVLNETSDENWVIQPEIANWKHGETPSDPIAMSSVAGSTVEFSYLTKSGKPLESQPTAIGDYILVAVAYSRDGTELARSQVKFKITGIDGALIALIVIISVLLLVILGLIIFFVVKRKLEKGGDNGGDNGGNNGGDTPTDGEGNNLPEGENGLAGDQENNDTPPNMPELTQISEYNSSDQIDNISPDQTELQQNLITPKPTAKKVRSAAQKVRSKNTKIRSANAKVRAKKLDGGSQPQVGNQTNVVDNQPQVGDKTDVDNQPLAGDKTDVDNQSSVDSQTDAVNKQPPADENQPSDE